jgi:arylsulfatase A-like enzyme/Tfp pilus assembly protein PilF
VPPREIRVAADMKPADVVPARPGEYAGANLLIVTFDTTRADRLGCYGNDEIRTPAVDRLAREGVMFTKAVAPSPTTLPSHASIMTGLYPVRHGARANGVYRLAEEHLTLGEILSGHGYATGAMVSAFVLESQFGIDQGFRDFDDETEDTGNRGGFEVAERAADATTERAEAWLRQKADGPFFLWVHYYDPHLPYEAPAPFRDQYALSYDAEIAFADFNLGRLLAVVDELGLTDNTLVVLAGDHGEGLGQHDEASHACLIYDSTMHVPLVMRCGDRLGGGVYMDREVSLVDIAPTVLTMLGVEVPEGLDGADLTRPAVGPRPIFFETFQGLADHGWAPLLGIREGSLKYIYGPETELYDLSQDPFEARDLAGSRPQVAAALQQRLQDFYGESLEQAASSPPAAVPDAEALAKLRALGYLGGAGAEASAPAERPHPKRMIPLMAEVLQAQALEATEGRDAMVARLEEIVDEHPDFYYARHLLGRTFDEQGDIEAAEAEFVECLRIRPDHAKSLLSLARLNTRAKRLDEARTLYRRTLELHPNHIIAVNEYAVWLVQQGEFSEAYEMLTRALRMQPRDHGLPDILVDVGIVINRTDEVVALFRELLEDDPGLPMVRNGLARIHLSRGEFADAIALLRDGIEAAPDEHGLINNLAYLLATCPDENLRRPIEAIVMLESLCADTGYQDPTHLHTLAMVYANALRMDEAITVAERAKKIAATSDDPEHAKLAPAIGRTLEQYRLMKEQGLGSELHWIPAEEEQEPGPEEADAVPPADGTSGEG